MMPAEPDRLYSWLGDIENTLNALKTQMISCDAEWYTNDKVYWGVHTSLMEMQRTIDMCTMYFFDKRRKAT